jgi:hypothetical protein
MSEYMPKEDPHKHQPPSHDHGSRHDYFSHDPYTHPEPASSPAPQPQSFVKKDLMQESKRWLELPGMKQPGYVRGAPGTEPKGQSIHKTVPRWRDPNSTLHPTAPNATRATDPKLGLMTPEKRAQVFDVDGVTDGGVNADLLALVKRAEQLKKNPDQLLPRAKGTQSNKDLLKIPTLEPLAPSVEGSTKPSDIFGKTPDLLNPALAAAGRMMRSPAKTQPQETQLQQSHLLAQAFHPPEIGNDPADPFKRQLAIAANKRLMSNQKRLTDLERIYDDPSNKNTAWRDLYVLADKDSQLKRQQDQASQQLLLLMGKHELVNTPIGKLLNQTPLKQKFGLPDPDKPQPLDIPGLGSPLLNTTGAKNPGVTNPNYQAQVDELQQKIQLLAMARHEFRAANPALACVDTEKMAQLFNAALSKTPRNEFLSDHLDPAQNQIFSNQIGEGFQRMRIDMNILSSQIQTDPTKALLFDRLLSEQMATLKDDPQGKAARAWVKGEQEKDAKIKGVLAGGGLITTLAGFAGGPLGLGSNAIYRRDGV